MDTNENQEYFLKQIETGCLSQFSYFLESNQEAAVIDPIRDCDVYLDLLKSKNSKLKYIFMTHFHADFVSGHLELAKTTGAKIVYGPNAQTEFEIHSGKDKEIFDLGCIQLQLIHTPGHTLESSSYLLLVKGEAKVVFTGDCLFLGEVGRPDLAVAGNITERDLASMLYDSLQVLKQLPESTVVYPGHGAGSACGKRIVAGGSDLLSSQKKTNYALNDNLLKEEFIEMVTSNLPTPPAYFFHDVMLNKKGYKQIEEVLSTSLKPLSPEFAFKDEYVVIDSRDFSETVKLFVRGSYLISLKMTYAIWTATLFSPDQKIVIIAEPGKEKESILRLSRVGYDNVVGYIDGGFNSIQNYVQNNPELKNHLVSMETPEVKAYLESQNNAVIYDVREPGEYSATGVLSNAKLVPLGKLEDSLKLNMPDKDLTYGVHCKTGGRAALAGSIFMKNGFDNIVFLGGILQMQSKGINLVEYKP